jgi:site-specific recombinase XerD
MLTAVIAVAPTGSAGANPPRSLDPKRLLAEHDAFVDGLPCRNQAKYLRRRGGERLLAAHPDLQLWMSRPIADRITEARRLQAWPFLSWCFATGRLVPELDLLAGKGKGGHFSLWGRLHPDDMRRVHQAAGGFDWCPAWRARITDNAFPLVCLTRAITLDQLTVKDLDAVEEAISSATMLTGIHRQHWLTQHRGVRALCYQLGLVDDPPTHANLRRTTPGQRADRIAQPEIRRVVARYLTTIAATLRPATVTSRAASLTLLASWLADTHPEVTSLRALSRAHLEAFCTFNASRACRGRRARQNRPISVSHHAHTLADLRCFFDDLTAWGWAERPTRLLLHRSDIPRLPAPLPRALAPDLDTALMAAVAELDDPAARAGITLLRGAGLRLGELLDLELDCLWDLTGHGTWLKVPLGKLATERVVPLDDATLVALDGWMAIRGRQRDLPHPRHGRPTAFLFTLRGARIGASRIRRGLDVAVDAAGLTGRDGHPLRITPHQLRHTYATQLVNAGMSMQALMALLGHVTPEMTLRYASLAGPTVRGAYDAAMAKVRSRQQLPLIVADRPVVPDRVQWLHAEMLKTRVAHGYCSRHLAAEACPYANICEQCDNYTTSTEFLPQLEAQLADELALRADAEARSWNSEVARHARVIASLERHLNRLKNTTTSTARA